MVSRPPSRPDAEPTTRELPRPDLDAAEPSQSVVEDLLSNERRRYVLYYLLGADRPATVEEITEQVAVWETGTRADEVPEDAYERVHVALRHKHLPRLDDADAVEHDRERDVVALADEVDLLTRELYLAAERESTVE